MSLYRPPVVVDAAPNVCFNVEIRGNTYRIFTELLKEEIRLAFVYGAYEQFVAMHVTGALVEDVSRDGNNIETTQTTAPPISEIWGWTINDPGVVRAYEAAFVAGAGNGFFGFGANKVKRFPDLHFRLGVTAKRNFRLEIIKEKFKIVVATYNTNTMKCQVELGGKEMFRLVG